MSLYKIKPLKRETGGGGGGKQAGEPGPKWLAKQAKWYTALESKYSVKSQTRLYRVSLKKGNPSFQVHYSIINNYFFKMYTSLESSFSLLSYDTINMINKSRMTDYIQSEVALAETELFKISGWLLHWVHYGF